MPFAFTVEEVALMGRYPHVHHRETARDRAIVRSCLAATDTLSLAERFYPNLSGGEKQRTHWARALAQLDTGDLQNGQGGSLQGKCLLLDEPTSSLDLAHQHSLLGRARLLAAAGAGVLVILHDLNLAAQYADIMVLLQAGRIVATGTAGSVMVPAILNSVYDVDTGVIPHPDHGKPWMFVRSSHDATHNHIAQEQRPSSRTSGNPEASRPHSSLTPHVPA